MEFSPGTPAPKPVKIICTRGFTPIYNNEYLVRSLAFLPDSIPDFRVTFISCGPLLNDVRALADRLLLSPIRKKVDFLGGISKKLLIEQLRKTHIYVSLSRSDGTSISLLEGLACGLFPVLSDIPQNREWITPGANNGFLVPLDQPIVGVGYKNFGDTISRYSNGEYGTRDPHNFWLMIATGIGVPACIILAWFFVTIGKSQITLGRYCHGDEYYVLCTIRSQFAVTLWFSLVSGFPIYTDIFWVYLGVFTGFRLRVINGWRHAYRHASI